MAQICYMSGPLTIEKSTARDAIAASNLFFPADGSPPVEWRIADGLTDYEFRRGRDGGARRRNSGRYGA